LTKAETRFGRAGQNDVVLEDGHVSSKHAMIVQQADQFTLIDLGSANGTYVNEQRISGPVVLEPGDALRFGESGFVFRRLMLVTKRRLKGAPRPPGTSAVKRPT
jgi:pSer/pThr/pTyr-binding forkhead associated (FHA) protein